MDIATLSYQRQDGIQPVNNIYDVKLVNIRNESFLKVLSSSKPD